MREAVDILADDELRQLVAPNETLAGPIEVFRPLASSA